MKDDEAYDFSKLILRHLKKELNEKEEQAFLMLISNDEQKKRLFDHYQNGKQIDQDLKYYKRVDTDAAWKKVMAKKTGSKQPVNKAAFPSFNRLKTWLPYAAVLICIAGFGFWKLSTPDDRLVKDNQFGFANDVLAGPNHAILRLSNGNEINLGTSEAEIKDGTTTLSLTKNQELIYRSGHNKKNSQINEIEVSNAGKFKVSLSDGSVVWVSSSSKLKYPVVFNGAERRVSLEGEAYFSIAKDAKKPFYVEVGGKTIRVLGTQFNVSAYTGQVRTTLVEGSVRIQDERNTGLLKPGQQAVFGSEGITIRTANVEKDIAWKNGYFTFDHDRLKDIMKEIARWYEVKVTYEGNYKDEVYTGSILKTTSLGGVLQALTDVSGLHFEIDGRNLKVKKN